MAEFIRTEEKVVNVGEPVVFENNTDSDFSVSAAIVFRKSGLYDVSIVGRRIIISKVTERSGINAQAIQPDIKQAAKLLSDFIESCPGGDSYLITPDGEVLRTDWGYAMEGIQLIYDWAERREE